MDVYVEYAIVDNFVMDYLIINLTVLGKNAGVKSKIIAALLGTVFAVYLPIFKIPVYLSVLLKIAVGIIMVAVTASFNGLKSFLVRTFTFYLVSFAFGGIIYGVCFIFNIKYDLINNVYQSKIPLFVWLLIGYVIYLVLYKAFGTVYKNKKIYPFLRQCELYVDGQKIKARGFIDSGNMITYNGFYSVCVADLALRKHMNKCGFLQGRYIGEVDFQTASGKSVMRIYEIDKIKVFNGQKENIIFKAKIGITDKDIKFSDEYSLILPGDFA